MLRRTLDSALGIGLMVLLALGTAQGAKAQAGGGSRPPNVVFILADDLGWGDLGCYGNSLTRTPNLDRLARQGALFTQFYVTAPVCSPSRCGYLTGEYPGRHKIHGHYATPEQNARRGMSNWLEPETATLPRLLQQAGYTTAHIGKWHLGGGRRAPAPEPSAYGFDFVRSTTCHNATWEKAGGNDPYFRARSSRMFVDEAISFIMTNRDRPFYLQLWSLVPHATLNPLPEQLKPYAGQGPGGPGFPHRSARQIFSASVTDLDTQVGRLLAKLDELKLTGQTLVVFSSDNGPEEIAIRNAGHSGVGSPGPFRGRKRSLYEGGVRLPFLVRWPGHVPAGKVDNQSVLSGADLLPTVCRMAGVRLPEGYHGDGEDRLDVLLGNPTARTKPLLWEWRFNIAGPTLNRSPMLAIRDGKWKLLLNPDRSRVELYDIPADPSELNNLAERHPEVVERLASTVLSWQKTLPPGPVDPGAGKNDYPWPKESR
jgi:N-acetylgalactosamine-6-sulfatase